MDVKSSDSLALQRTFLAHERTLMAWVRTSTSLISFGFTIYKFFAYLVETEGIPTKTRLVGPREFAVGMISVGVIALALAVVQERRAVELLRVQYGTVYSSLAEKIAGLLAFFGLVLLTLVLLRR